MGPNGAHDKAAEKQEPKDEKSESEGSEHGESARRLVSFHLNVA